MTESESGDAPGRPGIEPRWTSSAKTGVGTAVGARSRVWFTISHGIVNEVYYPRVDLANTRDVGLIVTDGAAFFSEEKRHTSHEVVPLAPGVPGYRLTNVCAEGRYRVVKTAVCDPRRDVLLQGVHFQALRGALADYRAFVLAAPHIGNQGYGNDARVGDYKGVPMLFARRGGCALALACSADFVRASCGYAGVSDGWQDLRAHGRLTRLHARARDGNVALTGEVDLAACGGRFLIALAFGRDEAEAGQAARAALLQDFDHVVAAYGRGWAAFQSNCLDLDDPEAAAPDVYRASTAVLKTHEDKGHAGGIIASLSVPWGNSKGDHDLGGYHLVWPRDLVESAGGLLAAGHAESARTAMAYLMSTQEADGHWAQNMWLDGTPYWNGVQMDETALPILLADALRREHALRALRPWPTVRRAASYLVRNGPVTPQDRWEEESGYSPFTLAAEVAALLAAADFADEAGESRTAAYLRETADAWNDGIERWTYVTGTPLARSVGVDGYYARIAPAETTDTGSARGAAASLVSPDALALVRFGLRAADDPRVVNTVRVIDAALRRETATGPVWHRYNGDRYGEHDDGAAYDGSGRGRGWPLLAGERAHYELAAGNAAEAARLRRVLRAQASAGGLIPEQVWDAPDVPARELFNGRPAGAAMPLVWAHAEYVKLARSLRDGRVFDTPAQTVRRYVEARRTSPHASWRFNSKVRVIASGTTLRLETLAPALVHWSADGWRTARDAESADSGLGVWYADLSTASLPEGAALRFTFYWPQARRWEGADFVVEVGRG
ncbi:MAG TPA: glucan 1,4-alpha-glucosidase [Gemmatimonadaceae bacterium]|nr:glucan 1,4-alpha-glucosidase [Gemmatimonadaceae bacterium]